MKKTAGGNSPKAPATLSPEARAWWKEICADWNFEAADLVILESSLEAFDRMRQAQKILKKEGILMRDRYGILKSHPANAVERDAKATMARLFKVLHLNINPVKERLGRPPGRKGQENAN